MTEGDDENGRWTKIYRAVRKWYYQQPIPLKILITAVGSGLIFESLKRIVVLLGLEILTPVVMNLLTNIVFIMFVVISIVYIFTILLFVRHPRAIGSFEPGVIFFEDEIVKTGPLLTLIGEYIQALFFMQVANILLQGITLNKWATSLNTIDRIIMNGITLLLALVVIQSVLQRGLYTAEGWAEQYLD